MPRHTLIEISAETLRGPKVKDATAAASVNGVLYTLPDEESPLSWKCLCEEGGESSPTSPGLLMIGLQDNL